MTSRDTDLSRHLRANVGKEGDGGWPEKHAEKEKRYEALLDRWEAFGCAYLQKHAQTPQDQVTARQIHELLPDEPYDDYGQDWRP